MDSPVELDDVEAHEDWETYNSRMETRAKEWEDRYASYEESHLHVSCWDEDCPNEGNMGLWTKHIALESYAIFDKGEGGELWFHIGDVNRKENEVYTLQLERASGDWYSAHRLSYDQKLICTKLQVCYEYPRNFGAYHVPVDGVSPVCRIANQIAFEVTEKWPDHPVLLQFAYVSQSEEEEEQFKIDLVEAVRRGDEPGTIVWKGFEKEREELLNLDTLEEQRLQKQRERKARQDKKRRLLIKEGVHIPQPKEKKGSVKKWWPKAKPKGSGLKQPQKKKKSQKSDPKEKEEPSKNEEEELLCKDETLGAAMAEGSDVDDETENFEEMTYLQSAIDDRKRKKKTVKRLKPAEKREDHGEDTQEHSSSSSEDPSDRDSNDSDVDSNASSCYKEDAPENHGGDISDGDENELESTKKNQPKQQTKKATLEKGRSQGEVKSTQPGAQSRQEDLHRVQRAEQEEPQAQPPRQNDVTRSVHVVNGSGKSDVVDIYLQGIVKLRSSGQILCKLGTFGLA